LALFETVTVCKKDLLELCLKRHAFGIFISGDQRRVKIFVERDSYKRQEQKDILTAKRRIGNRIGAKAKK
jgi:hypothetical protein